MSGAGRLLDLVRFVIASNRVVLAMPLVWLPYVAWGFSQGDAFRFRLFNLESVFFFIFLPQVAVLLFAPGAWSRESAGANPLEFLLTRAIDRRQYFRALTITYLAIGLLPAAGGFALALTRPTVEVIMLDEGDMQRSLSSFPGSHVAPDDPAGRYQPPTIVIPWGRVRMAALDMVDVLILAMLALAPLLLLARLRRPGVLSLLLMAPFAILAISLPFSGLADDWARLAGPRIATVAAIAVCAALVVERVYERWFERLEILGG